MKKTLALLALCSVSILSYAQNIQIFLHGESQVVNGTEVITDSSVLNDEWEDMQTNFDIKNNTSNDVRLNFKRFVLWGNDIFKDYMCNQGMCPVDSKWSLIDRPAMPDYQELVDFYERAYTTNEVSAKALQAHMTAQGEFNAVKVRYVVYNMDAPADSAYVDVISLNDGSVSIHEVNPENLKFNVIPSEGQLRFATPLAEPATFFIHDLSGKVLHKQALQTGIQQQELHLNQLPSGLYSCTLVLENGQYHTEKINL